MTTIVALEHNGNIFMGADKRVSTDDCYQDSISKIIQIDNVLIAGCGTLRDKQIIESKLILPTIDPLGTPYRIFQDDILKQFLKLKNNEGWSASGETLICFNSTIITLSSYLDFTIETNGFASIGSGSKYALGSLYETNDQDPGIRIKKALKCASMFDLHTSSNIDILSISYR